MQCIEPERCRGRWLPLVAAAAGSRSDRQGRHATTVKRRYGTAGRALLAAAACAVLALWRPALNGHMAFASGRGRGFDTERQGPDVCRVSAVGGHVGSFLLELGGHRLLVNPRLDRVNASDPQVADYFEMVDYVVLTTQDPDFLHLDTVRRFNPKVTNFIASEAAGQKLKELGCTNVAVLAAGPTGRIILDNEEKKHEMLVSVVPGAVTAPWGPQEIGFIFADLDTGLGIGYEAMSQYLGRAWLTFNAMVPEEAYQIDYLVVPNLREAGEVCKSLVKKGTPLRGVIWVPHQLPLQADLLEPLRQLDAAVDTALGGTGDERKDFKKYIKDQGEKKLKEIKLIYPKLGGGPTTLH